MSTLDFAEKVDQILSTIEESGEISAHNAQLLQDYHRDRVLNGIGDATQQKDLAYLKQVAKHVDKPLDEMDKSDVKEVMSWVHDRELQPATVETYKKVTKVFWTWLNDADEPKEVDAVSWIQSNGADTGNDTLPKDLLTQQDIEAQVDAANNPRDKAFIWLLYETGARIGELIDLTVGDIEDRKHGKKITIHGKTGARRVPLVESVPHLNRWLSDHPNPEKDAPLWCKIQQGGPTEHIDPHDIDDIRDVHGIGPSYAEQLEGAGIETGTDLVSYDPEELADIVGVREATTRKWFRQFNSDVSLSSDAKLGYRYIREKILKATMERAGIDKPSNPHHYRHSRASHLATELKEAQLCEWFGWVQGSDVPARYVHLSSRDIDNAYDQMHGLYEPDEDEQQPDVVECLRCQELNDPNAAFCMRCGFALDQETAAELEEQADSKLKESYKQADPTDSETMEKLDMLDSLLDDPEVKTALLEKLDEG